jgi:hypothetical protein
MMTQGIVEMQMLVLQTLMAMAVLAILRTQAGAVVMMMMILIQWLCAVHVVVEQMMV